VGILPQELNSLQLTGEPVMVPKKLSGTQRERLRKQKKATAAQQADGEPGARAANRAPGLMSIPGAAVAQKDHCHLVGHLRMLRAR